MYLEKSLSRSGSNPFGLYLDGLYQLGYHAPKVDYSSEGVLVELWFSLASFDCNLQ